MIKLLLSSEDIIRVGGLVMIIAIVYAETGIFFCFWLPGDYLLFSAGLFAGTGDLPVEATTLMLSIMGAAIAGNYTGYFFGYFLGNRFMAMRESIFFKRKYIDSTRKVFDKYGGRALIVGRFLPIVRTFAPILAGIVAMKPRVFFFYNIGGAVLWVGLLCGSGYYLGREYKDVILGYLPYIIGGFILFTSVTVFNSWLKIRRDAKADDLKAKAESV